MKKYLIIIVILMIFPLFVNAQRGCCSHHGGVCGCNKNGQTVCCDNTLSPSCRCDPPKVKGCTDSKADNYNANANSDDGSCKYTIKGCTDSKANNYNSSATKDDGSCKYDVYGCTDSKAKNYNYKATKDDGSCTYNKKEEKHNEDIVEEVINSNSKNGITDSKENGTSNDISTILFYLTSVLGLGGYGVKKKIKK